MNLVLSPHNDDETLFCSFTIIRERAHVVVCYRGADGYGDPDEREAESTRAVTEYLRGSIEQWDFGSWSRKAQVRRMQDFDVRLRPQRVWAPDRESTHPEHLCVAILAEEVFRGRLTTYHTYRDERRTGGPLARVTSPRRVDWQPDWAYKKLAALSQYRTQIQQAMICDLFLDDQREYYGSDL